MASRAPQGPGVGLWPRPDERGCGAIRRPKAGIERAETAAGGGRRDAPEGGFNRLCRGPTRRRQTLGANGVMGRAAGRVEVASVRSRACPGLPGASTVVPQSGMLVLCMS